MRGKMETRIDYDYNSVIELMKIHGGEEHLLESTQKLVHMLKTSKELWKRYSLTDKAKSMAGVISNDTLNSIGLLVEPYYDGVSNVSHRISVTRNESTFKDNMVELHVREYRWILSFELPNNLVCDVCISSQYDVNMCDKPFITLQIVRGRGAHRQSHRKRYVDYDNNILDVDSLINERISTSVGQVSEMGEHVQLKKEPHSREIMYRNINGCNFPIVTKHSVDTSIDNYYVKIYSVANGVRLGYLNGRISRLEQLKELNEPAEDGELVCVLVTLKDSHVYKMYAESGPVYKRVVYLVTDLDGSFIDRPYKTISRARNKAVEVDGKVVETSIIYDNGAELLATEFRELANIEPELIKYNTNAFVEIINDSNPVLEECEIKEIDAKLEAYRALKALAPFGYNVKDILEQFKTLDKSDDENLPHDDN